MVHSTVSRVEEKVSRKSILCRNLRSHLCLLIRTSRQLNTELAVYQHSKTRAVATLCQRLTAPDVRIAEELFRERDHRLPVGSRACRAITYTRRNLTNSLQYIAKCRITGRCNDLFCKRELILSLLLNISIGLFPCKQILLVYESAHCSGLYVDPLGVRILDNITEIVRIENADDSVFISLTFTNIQERITLCKCIFLADFREARQLRIDHLLRVC